MHIVLTFPYPLHTPGGGTLDCVQTAIHLRGAGADVTVVPLAESRHVRLSNVNGVGVMLGRREAELREAGVEVVNVSAHPRHHWLDSLQVKDVLKALTARKAVDAVLGWYHEVAFLRSFLHSQQTVFGMIAAASYAPGRTRRLSHVLRSQLTRTVPASARPSPSPSSLTGDDPSGLLGRSGRWLQRRVRQTIEENLITAKCLREADVVFARSRFTAREIVDLFGVDQQNVTVSYCGVDPSFARASRRYAPEVTRLLFFGWCVPQKGIFDLLDALGRMTTRGERNWCLKIVGWGNHDLVRRVARERGIEDRIELLGQLEHPELICQLEWAHLAILPSHAESFGLAVAEAEASGLPVIAYDVGAVPEVVERDVTGWLVPQGRVDLLAAAIGAAMQQPERAFQMGLAGRERVTQMFSWERTAATMLQRIVAAKEKVSASFQTA